eukprot:comp12012_c0_seq1/m.6707 comp12012_c0_seq1/g.6707  ORF comp12012_c0_seq1/g.6707 comp12012_c0_seq1/m.6707 type:complete len:121 (-) comp12012_c0_seq1:145-507(-)
MSVQIPLRVFNLTNSVIGNGIGKALSGWVVNASGYRKYGLLLDDMIMEEDPDVQTALSRLSSKEQYDRQFRLKVALDLSLKHQILPKELWTTDKDDKRYLWPVLQQVAKERVEREQLDAM